MSGQELLEKGAAMNLNTIERWVTATIWVILIAGLLALFGCARMPYTVRTVHEDQRVLVTIQREVKPAGYSHPVQLSADEITAMLTAFSFREKQRLPLRWFAEEAPPRPIFRWDELQALAPILAQALQKAGPEERVYFQVLAPGINPAAERDTTGGWIAVRDPYFHLTLDHFHAQFPIRSAEHLDMRYPAVPPLPRTHLLYFEPARFWITDPYSGDRGVQFREFLKTVSLPQRK